MIHDKDGEMYCLVFLSAEIHVQRIKIFKFLFDLSPVFFTFSFSQENVIKKLFGQFFSLNHLVIDKFGNNIIYRIQCRIADRLDCPLLVKREGAPQPITQSRAGPVAEPIENRRQIFFILLRVYSSKWNRNIKTSFYS